MPSPSHVRMRRRFHVGSHAASRVAAQLILPFALLAFAPGCRADDSSLPDAPQAQASSPSAKTAQSQPMTGPGRDNMVLNVHVGPAYPIHPDDKWDTIVNAGQQPESLSATDTLIYAAHEQVLPTVLVPGLVAAGWGQLFDFDPHAGTDAGGFGERLGYNMLRQATDRLSGDGLFAAALRQDPRFYRETNGPIVRRGLRAVRQTFMRRNSNGDGGERVNASGILGHAFGSYLAIAYYPDGYGAGAATRTFATAVTGDMESKLILEFMPDLLRLAFRRNQ